MCREEYRPSYRKRVSAQLLRTQQAKSSEIRQAARMAARDRFPRLYGVFCPSRSNMQKSDRNMCLCQW